MIPYSRNPDFVVREEIFTQLKEQFAAIGEDHIRVALFGLGGIGLLHPGPRGLNLLLIHLGNLKSQFTLHTGSRPHTPKSPCFGSMQAALIASIRLSLS